MRGSRGSLHRSMERSQCLVTLCVSIFTVGLSGPELRGQEPPPGTQPSVAAPVPPTSSTPAVPGEFGPTRLLLAPTGRSMPSGRGAVGLTEIGIPWCEWGLTRRVSVLAGAAVPLGVLGISPKIQVYGGRRAQAALGVVASFDDGGFGGIAYGVVTLGAADAGVTLGYGYGFGQLADSGGSRGVLFLGGEKAIGRHLRLIVEGYVGGAAMGLPDATFLGGLRFGSGRWSVDVGVVVPVYETGSGTPVPLLTIGWAF